MDRRFRRRAGQRRSCKLVSMKICILGATGLVGRETIDLTNRAWPGAELVLFASRDQELKHGAKTYPVRAAASLESADAPRGDLAFVALDDEHSKRYVPHQIGRASCRERVSFLV